VLAEADPGLPLDRHPVCVYVVGLAPGSRRTQTAALRIIAQLVGAEATEMTLPWWRLDFAHTSAIRSKLAERFAPATGNRMLAALRGVLRAAFKLGLMSADQMTRACSIDPVRGSRVQKGRALSQGELRALFTACDPKTAGGARNAALLGLLYGGGLRRAEVVALDLADFDGDSGAITVKGSGLAQERNEHVAPLGFAITGACIAPAVLLLLVHCECVGRDGSQEEGEEEGEGNLGTWRHQDEKGKRGAKSVVVTAPKPKKKKPAKAKPVAAPKSGMAVPKINDPEGKPSVVLEAPPDK
jgi:hypothetical protein